MLGGKQVVFLSCMTAYADRLARPIRDWLNAAGYHAVIVMDEPSLRGDFGPEDKVDGYLEAADAFVALATHDKRMGPSATAGNVLDEIARARRLPGLRDVVLVMKEDGVKLPSNINPVYELLDPNDPDAAAETIERQLKAWDVLPENGPTPPPVVTALTENYLAELLDGIDLGDHAKINARIRRLFGKVTKQDQNRVARDIFERLLVLTDDGREIHIVGDCLLACAHIDAALIEPTWIEQLVESQVFQHRTAAALILSDQAVVNPGKVPLDYIAKLAKPSTEDWYVYSPAIAAAKELALTRYAALEILLDLASSPDATDRLTTVIALAGISGVNPAIVWGFAREHLERLANDADQIVAGPAAELLAKLRQSDPDVRHAYSHFGL